MKKFLILFLVLGCLLGLSACGETLEEPPELRVVSSDGTVTASKGTSSWSYEIGLGTSQAIESDSIHPLGYKDFVETLITADQSIALEFDVEPDRITAIECWSDAYWDADYTTEGEAFPLDGGKVTLKPGGWIYYIAAHWDRDNYDGSCHYVFHVIYTEGDSSNNRIIYEAYEEQHSDPIKNDVFTDEFFANVVEICDSRTGPVSGEQMEPVIRYLKGLTLTPSETHLSSTNEDGHIIYGLDLLTFRKMDGTELVVLRNHGKLTGLDGGSYVVENENLNRGLREAFGATVG